VRILRSFAEEFPEAAIVKQLVSQLLSAHIVRLTGDLCERAMKRLRL
jgi:hypothetical protein